MDMPQGSEVPEGWVSLTIQDVCDINPPKPKKGDLPGDTPVTFVPMPAVDAERGEISSPEIRPFSEVRSGFTAFKKGDVIMAKITPCMENGKAAVAKELVNDRGFGSTEFFVLRSNGSISPRYLFHYIRQRSFRSLAESNMTGSVGQKRVPKAFIQSAVIPLPPLPEQHRIVAAIEALFARLDATNARLERVPGILKQFRQVVLAAACDGRLTEDWRAENLDTEKASHLLNQIKKTHEIEGKGHGGKAASPTDGIHLLDQSYFPESWKITNLQWLCTPGRPITYGILKPGPDQVTGIPYIRVADFPNDKIVIERVRRTTKEIADNYKRSSLISGDVLLSIRGTVGRVCRVLPELEGANITQDTARISVHELLNADYVELYLRCPSVKKTLEKCTKGVAIRGVNIGDVRALQIAVPPLSEQHEIVRRVNAIFVLANKIEAEVKAARAKTETMRQSILAQAFSGRLVPTEAELARLEGRDYEPASVLLERIRSEKTEKKGGKRVQTTLV